MSRLFSRQRTDEQKVDDIFNKVYKDELKSPADSREVLEYKLGVLENIEDIKARRILYSTYQNIDEAVKAYLHVVERMPNIIKRKNADRILQYSTNKEDILRARKYYHTFDKIIKEHTFLHNVFVFNPPGTSIEEVIGNIRIFQNKIKAYINQRFLLFNASTISKMLDFVTSYLANHICITMYFNIEFDASDATEKFKNDLDVHFMQMRHSIAKEKIKTQRAFWIVTNLYAVLQKYYLGLTVLIRGFEFIASINSLETYRQVKSYIQKASGDVLYYSIKFKEFLAFLENTMTPDDIDNIISIAMTANDIFPDADGEYAIPQASFTRLRGVSVEDLRRQYLTHQSTSRRNSPNSPQAARNSPKSASSRGSRGSRGSQASNRSQGTPKSRSVPSPSAPPYPDTGGKKKSTKTSKKYKKKASRNQRPG
jgi:hypothetical protein